MNENYTPALHKVLELQQKIRDMHPIFERAYPIAIVEGNTFLVFDVDQAGGAYRLVTQAPASMPIPDGVRAAFDLECYEDKTACVVTGEVFDTLDGFIAIFHEFVHCYQASICEQKLKGGLEVARRAMGVGNFMWEIEHPFPYLDPQFTETYRHLLEAVSASDDEKVLQDHRLLRLRLQPLDYEYLVWQEWKEGLARWIENRLQRFFNLSENHYGSQPPYHRITLYEGGAGLIAALSRDEPGLTNDLEKLFQRIAHA
jgi:hypothetical protein